jgi:DNA-directed RNA polymerase subunit RPC12/RpoP
MYLLSAMLIHRRDEGRRLSVRFSTGGFPMSIQCPQCQSLRISSKDVGKRAGAVIGTVGGGVSGAAGALSGAEFGGMVGAVGGPVGIALGALSGAILGGLVGAATGGITGSKLGEVIDQRVLDNYVCRDCGHTFSINSH